MKEMNEIEYNINDEEIVIIDKKYERVYTIVRENSKIFITNYVNYKEK